MEIKMDFKNLASKIIDDVSGIKSTETSKHVEENDILEGLDLDFSETVSKDLSEDFDLDIEDEIPEERSQKVEQLFDGYLGEKNFDPNPLEYGPNAMYRKNGTVYRKSVDNLWEVYLKDGAQGPRGVAGGSGVGVQEVKRIISETVSVSGTGASTWEQLTNKPIASTNTSGVLTSSDWNKFNNKADLSAVSATDWSNLLGPVFTPTYSASNPLVNELSISAGVSQRIAIPSGTYVKCKFTGFGPFRYRLGTSAAVAVSTDLYAEAGDSIISNKNSNTHLAVYGISYGTVYVEGGSIG